MISLAICYIFSHMNHRITSLPALSCFRVAAKTESFSAAAEQLNLTHGAVSRAVRLLEEDLGVALFERKHRRVFLTEHGRELAQAVDAGLGRIEEAVHRIRQSQQSQDLVLSCEPTLLMRWLIPQQEAIQAALPGRRLQLLAGGGPVSLETDVDMAIRRDDFPLPPDSHVTPLFEEAIGPVCRPDKVEAFFDEGMVPSPSLQLHTQTRPHAWQDWYRLTGSALPLRKAEGRSYEHFYFSLQAAVAGLGVAIGPWHLVQEDIANGLLCAPLGFRADGSRYQLLTRSALAQNAEAQALVKALRSIARPFEGAAPFAETE